MNKSELKDLIKGCVREILSEDYKLNIKHFIENTLREELSVEAVELQMYIDNNQQLYRQKENIWKNLQKKKDKGTYDIKKSPKLFQYLVDAGAKLYIKDHGSVGDTVRAMFPKPDREKLAKEFVGEFEDEFDTQDGKLF